MKTEIICTLIALAGTVVSSFISWNVSRSAAAKEIEKMKMEWEREDVVSSDDEFAEMAASVANFIKWNHSTSLREAASRVAAIRSKESGELALALDTLYEKLNRDSNRRDLDNALTNVINEKRKQKGNKQKSN